MAAASRIALILGAGARVGSATTDTFLAAGYRTARVSRTQDPSKDTATLLNIPGDLANPSNVEHIFATVRAKWGEPSVVVYNGVKSHQTPMDQPIETFNVPTDTFAEAQTVNTVSSFVAMREALDSFQSANAHPGPKTFMFTGNTLNQGPFPGFLALGTGKAGAAHMVESADGIYSKEADIRFFYVDERQENGVAMFTGLGGQGHADAFLGMAERKGAWKDWGWLATFVSGDEGKETRPKEFPQGLIPPS